MKVWKTIKQDHFSFGKIGNLKGLIYRKGLSGDIEIAEEFGGLIADGRAATGCIRIKYKPSSFKVMGDFLVSTKGQLSFSYSTGGLRYGHRIEFLRPGVAVVEFVFT